MYPEFEYEERFNRLELKLKSVFALPFVKDLQAAGGEVFIVGGAVRDYLRRQSPKDIDLIVAKLSYESLAKILEQHGTVKVVGEAFGVILFKTQDFEGEIALPRVDSKDTSLKGHKSIIAQSDPFIPVEKDLARRDFTINAIALTYDKEGNQVWIDPFKGRRDLKQHLISQVNSETFADDPLRLMRAIQFAARFNFSLSEETLENITKNSNLIKEITPERILMEFEKVISKDGNIKLFLSFLNTTNLFENIFGFKIQWQKTLKLADSVRTLGELLFLCSLSQKNESELAWAEICKKTLKIDNKTEREIVALEHVFDNSGSALEKRWNIFNAIDIFPDVIKSQFLKQNTESEPFIKRRYPHTYKELNINGHRLMSEFGLRNEQIGKAYKNMLLAVFTDKVHFENTDELLKYIK